MVEHLQTLALFTVTLPLLGSFVAGFFRKQIGRSGAHYVTISAMMLSFILSLMIAYQFLTVSATTSSADLYVWIGGGDFFPYKFSIGFLLDPLSVTMIVIVNFISLLVHVYSIGYMADDDGYQRFFSYISLFTFFMLMLVTAKNFLQLFFGWEGVGLVSYLLIGFWYTRESAIQGSLKAFLVNRVGDFGFLLGIAVLFAYTNSIDYNTVFAAAHQLSNQTIELWGQSYSVTSIACILLFVGAMGKSAQVPLHVWLPESMEGPTPISALIHAATMVTAGIFMVARMSPLFETSEAALNLVLVIGATGALFTGLLALVMNDIKRVIAYSTLSQLGYMMAAMGASAYAAGIFHLLTHACFKALLFLGAGSVIIALHHEQDMRKMGGLWQHMPITYVTAVIGTLALCALPPFSGFYSKDVIIEAVNLSTLTTHRYAFFCLQLGAFVTALYSFRALFMTFHGQYRGKYDQIYESPWVVTVPLLILAVPSIVLGAILVQPMLFTKPGLLGSAITVLPAHDVLAALSHHFHGALGMVVDGLFGLTFWLTLAGVFFAWLAYSYRPEIPGWLSTRFSLVYRILEAKYGFDRFNEWAFVRGGREMGQLFYRMGDRLLIDGILVEGSAGRVYWAALRARLIQTGYLFHYASAMIIALLILLAWLMLARV